MIQFSSEPLSPFSKRASKCLRKRQDIQPVALVVVRIQPLTKDMKTLAPDPKPLLRPELNMVLWLELLVIKEK